VIKEGGVMAMGGIVAGAVGGMALARLAASYLSDMQMPGLLPVIGAILVLLAAAIIASALPAARAARVDVIQALRSE
jgi:ABC-type antimicrobial peptide transport system permease subunit